VCILFQFLWQLAHKHCQGHASASGANRSILNQPKVNRLIDWWKLKILSYKLNWSIMNESIPEYLIDYNTSIGHTTRLVWLRRNPACSARFSRIKSCLRCINSCLPLQKNSVCSVKAPTPHCLNLLDFNWNRSREAFLSFVEKQFCWQNPSGPLARPWQRRANKQNIESPSDVCTRKASTLQWSSAQITLFSQTRQSA